MGNDLTLSYPVTTLDGQILLPAGQALTKETIDSLIYSAQNKNYEDCSLLKFGDIERDFINFITAPPYDLIFNNKEINSELFDHLQSVTQKRPVLEALEYFRKHDFHTYRHSLMVFLLAVLLSRSLEDSYKSLREESIAGPFHDIGKICVPLEILTKKTPLTIEEHRILKHHPLSGYVLLSYYLQDSTMLAARLARDHHERRDGFGYPRGIKQNDILIEIVAVADVYDALISPRPYRPVSYNNRTALEEITGMAENNEVSWDVAKALLAVNRNSKPHYKELRLSSERRGTPPKGNLYGTFEDEE